MTAFEALFVPAPVREAIAGQSWLDSMLRVERALADAGAKAGVVPAESAQAIAEACGDAAASGWEALLDQARGAGNPVEPLVRSLRARVGSKHDRWVHLGATSQDVLDTAAVLVVARALGTVDSTIRQLTDECAELAREHRSTPMVARTLLQQAVPTTFGLVAAGWLVAVLDARAALDDAWRRARCVQLGGAAGTLAALGDRGLHVVDLLAAELDLDAPTLPWHTNRVRVAELGATLSTLAGVCGKIGLDLALLSQTEVAEVHPAAGGASSTMPQKRNPVRAVLARACAQLAAAQSSVLQLSLVQEHQRAAGAWHAEWEALCGVLGYGGGAVAAALDSLRGVVVDTDRMVANLHSGGGLVVSERIAAQLTDAMGRGPAHELLADVSTSTAPLGVALRDDPRVAFADDELEDLLDPARYLGSSEQLVDRALARYETEPGGDS